MHRGGQLQTLVNGMSHAGRRMSDLEPRQHPIGTLAIVGVYGVLFAVGWLLVYVYVYLARGPVTP